MEEGHDPLLGDVLHDAAFLNGVAHAHRDVDEAPDGKIGNWVELRFTEREGALAGLHPLRRLLSGAVNEGRIAVEPLSIG